MIGGRLEYKGLAGPPVWYGGDAVGRRDAGFARRSFFLGWMFPWSSLVGSQSHRMGWCWPAGDEVAQEANRQAAVQPFLDLHPSAGVAAPLRSRQELQGMPSQLYRVVLAHRALMLEAQHPRQVQPHCWAIGGAGLGGWHGEAGVEPGQEGPQHLVGLCQGSGSSQAQFRHQPLLEGAPEALDSALGLGRKGQDGLDAQFPQSPAQLGGLALPSQLFLQGFRLLGVDGEDAVLVAVQGQRDSLGADDLPEKQEVALGVFLLPEQGVGGTVPVASSMAPTRVR